MQKSRTAILEWLLLSFLLFSVLWRGGKSLEATWILVGVTGALIVVDGMRVARKMENGKWRIENCSGLLWVLTFGFLGWTTLSYFFSTTGNYGLDEVLRDGALVLIFLWTMRHVGGESGTGFLHRFIHTMAVAAVLGAFFGLLVYVLQPVNRFVGTFFDYRFHTDYWPNAWAEFVLLAWPMIVLWMRGKSAQLQVAGCIMLGGVLATLLLSFSRGAMIAFGGQILLLSIWVWVQRRRNYEQELKIGNATLKMMLAKIGMIGVVAIALFFAANAARGQFHPVQSIGQKMTFTADEGGSSVSDREQFWKQSLHLIAERPLFGWGPYSFRFVQQRLQTGVLQTSDHPHNVFLKLAAERGIAAAILFAMLVAVILWPTVALLYCCTVRKRISDIAVQQFHNSTMQQFSLFVAVLGVLAHNLIDYNLQFVGIALPFWIMLGMLAGSAESGVRPPAGWAGNAELPGLVNIKFVHNFYLIIAVFLLTVALREGGFLVTSSIGRHAETREEFATALMWYDRSTSEWFSRDMHLSRALLRTMQGETERAQEAMDIFLHFNAEDPRGWRLQGDIAHAKGDRESAVDAYAKAYELGKWNDLSIALALAEVLVKDEPFDPAQGGQLEKSSEPSLLEHRKPELDALLGSFVEAIVHNAHFVALSHNAEDAIALSTFLAREFPESAPRYQVLAARADFAMRSERAKAKSRPAGYLW